MASALAMRSRSSVFRQPKVRHAVSSEFQEAWKVYTKTGAVMPHPELTRFPILKILSALVPGLYAGALISKRAAEFMDAHEIFIPAEDD